MIPVIPATGVIALNKCNLEVIWDEINKGESIGAENDRIMIGSWKKDDQMRWRPDKDGDYAAIFNADVHTIQVIWSKYLIVNRNQCSPCYPNQANIEEDGTYHEFAYCLSADMIDEYYETIISRIIHNYFE